MAPQLRAVAERVLQTLSGMVLLILSIVEAQENGVIDLDQGDEIRPRLTTILEEITAQRSQIEALTRAVQDRRLSRPAGPSAAPSSPASVASPASLDPTNRARMATPTSEVGQRTPAPSQASPNLEPTAASTTPKPSSAEPQPQMAAIMLWGQKVISFGTKHRGRSYATVYETDQGYLEWTRSRLSNLTDAQKDLIHYADARRVSESQSTVQPPSP